MKIRIINLLEQWCLTRTGKGRIEDFHYMARAKVEILTGFIVL